MESNPLAEPQTTIPIFIDGLRVGSVRDIVGHVGFQSGTLFIEEGSHRGVLQRAVNRAKAVDSADATSYEEEHERWRQACRGFEKLQVRLGASDGELVELGSIESNWRIEWQTADQAPPRF